MFCELIGGDSHVKSEFGEVSAFTATLPANLTDFPTGPI